MLFRLCLITMLLTGLVPAERLAARQSAGRPAVPTLRTVERSGPISIDGVLDETSWAGAPVGTGFIQREPIEGEPAGERTEVRVLFDDLAIYVAARMHDRDAGTIARQLVRRDGFGQYDYIEVAFDPNMDRRTGYLFRVSASNVQRDEYLYDDNEQDDAWDAVWESAVQRDDEGWTAEMRIPLSQLRYEPAENEQEWGINFARQRVSSNEQSHFALVSRLQQGVVSQFATLAGIRIRRASRLLAFRPYVLSRAYAAPATPGDPFFDGTSLASRTGMDVRYGLGGQFTVDATINPDFGQVEADPAVINLTAFETRFDERRPFFVEDAQVFDFSLSAGQDLYYSRRVGRPPQGRAPAGSDFSDIPESATILGAAKVTGRTSGGLSAGGLVALTRAETGRRAIAGQPVETFAAEPRAAFGVVRLRQDFHDGMSTLGGIVTLMDRALPGTGGFDFLPSSAVSGGIDYEHQWGNRTWQVFGYFSGSHVRGDSVALIRIQRSSSHYRQRPDFARGSVDSSVTAMTGMDWRFTLAKHRGTHWTGSFWLAQTTPGFEINDLGFSRRQEALDGGMRVRYQEIQPGPALRNYNVSFSTFHNFSHDALEDPLSPAQWQRNHVSGSFNLDAEVELLNYWSLDGSLRFRPRQVDRNATRGGPLIVSPRGYGLGFELQTDRRSMVNIGPQIDREWSTLDASSRWEFGVDVEIRPSSQVEISLEPGLSMSRFMTQYVAATTVMPYQPTFGTRYLFGEIDRTEFEMEVRADWVFSPKLTFQLFLQPLLSSGQYLRYHQLRTPSTFDFDTFAEGTFSSGAGQPSCGAGGTCTDAAGARYFDFDLDGVADYQTSDRDFNFQSLIGNAVIRWEYRPGSTIFLVWQRSQEDESGVGDFRLGRDLDALFGAPAENVFMVKLNYWFGM